MKAAVLAFILGGSVHAHADRLACEDASGIPAARARASANNIKARDVALTAAGLKFVAAPILSTSNSPAPATKKLSGNIVWVKLRVGCEEDVAGMATFAVDKDGKAYRVLPKLTSSDVLTLVCGSRPCERACGTPPTEKSYAFKLPDKVVYSGEREVAWKVQNARIEYDQPDRCTAGGGSAPAPATGQGGELAKLRAENATLRAENAAMKKKVEEMLARERERQKRLEKALGSKASDLK